MSTKRQLTPRQQDYANAIIDAGVAQRDEVESSFRERTPENEAIIASWGHALTRKRKEAQQEHHRRLQTQERCAYPECTNVIEVTRTWNGDPGTPRPTRALTVTLQMQGWHWEGWNKVENTKTTITHLWGCSPKHQEGIFRLDFALAPIVVEQTEEPSIQYPMGSETQWKVYELARKRAQELVAQSSSSTDLPQIRRTIARVAEKEVEALIAASDPAWLTDNLEQFRALYRQEFVEGYLQGLRTREQKPTLTARRFSRKVAH